MSERIRRTGFSDIAREYFSTRYRVVHSGFLPSKSHRRNAPSEKRPYCPYTPLHNLPIWL